MLLVGTFLLALVLCGTAIVAIVRPQTPATAGDSTRISQSRHVGPFRRIDSSGSIDLVIDAKATAPSIVIVGPSSAVATVQTDVADGTLTIAQPNASHFRLPDGARFRAVVGAPDLQGLRLAGSGDATLHGVSVRDLGIELAGSGNVDASGATDRLTVSLLGSGDIDAGKLVAGQVRVDVRGSGNASVNATQAIKATVEGSGDVRYAGKPAQVTRSVLGSGTITPD